MSKYNVLDELKIEFKPEPLNGRALTVEEVDIAKLAIDDVHFVSIETQRFSEEKSVIVRLVSTFALIVEGEETQCKVRFAACRTSDDDLSSFELEYEDIDSAELPGFDYEDLSGEVTDHFINSRYKEILHLTTLAPYWETLSLWLKSELRYRLSY
ncbi:hypothetical protein SAMN04487962_12535 [Marinobacter segnicrescens]|uniref:Uncharacterized protein n=1 Tax=Marinobacter segnicrescens TaxID=430453 RepID=A0A1I0H8D2_9GAMM|nr:hypothetical protein [Marinobacter segnicrescens]SET80021.1 hypothetical protein SAMN04487962_12535 [Marinobacter segnicrescens]